MIENAAISRRGLIRSGGLTISLGAVVAACGSDSGATEPGRVGNAPLVSELPQVEVNDAVLLRTATSVEHTLLDIYAQLTDLGYFDADLQPLIDRLVEDHAARAEELAELTTDAGGEPFECANPFLVERLVEPVMTNIVGDEAQNIEPSDDPARDALAVAETWESITAATYQNLVATLTDPALRQELILVGAEAARHAAVLAMRITGTPDGYLSPALAGEEVAPDETGLTPVYAIPGAFGSLAPITLTVGAASDAGTRFAILVQTPAENAYLYEGQSCDA